MGHAVDKADLYVLTVYCGLFGANQHSKCSYLLIANLIWGPLVADLSAAVQPFILFLQA